MVKKSETEVAVLRDQTAASRRDFVKAGAAAGLGAAILSAPGKAQAQRAPADIRWDYEADVIVCGSGATGIVAAKRARDLGADVLVLEQNFDIGGKLSHNGGTSSFGGGDPIQERDRRGLAGRRKDGSAQSGGSARLDEVAPADGLLIPKLGDRCFTFLDHD